MKKQIASVNERLQAFFIIWLGASFLIYILFNLMGGSKMEINITLIGVLIIAFLIAIFLDSIKKELKKAGFELKK